MSSMLGLGEGFAEPADRLEHVPANRSAAGPEGRRLLAAHLVIPVVVQVAIARNQRRMAGLRVVTAEHGGDVGGAGQFTRSAPDRIFVQHHVGIREQQDVARGRRGAGVAGRGRPPLARLAQDSRGETLRDFGGASVGGGVVDHDALQRPPRGPADRLQAAGQVVAAIVHRDDHRYRGSDSRIARLRRTAPGTR
jgi:hypothetical protein